MTSHFISADHAEESLVPGTNKPYMLESQMLVLFRVFFLMLQRQISNEYFLLKRL